ncbi:hypothetical protein T492DRAFT_874362 [Pavlovales sp. CCMP2436]|nr:hypothetical protein T492DRAFT_874362 [Pavlovales sp. CCMP2436]
MASTAVSAVAPGDGEGTTDEVSDARHETSELPSGSALQEDFGLFALAGGAHNPLPGADGGIRCECARCAAWTLYISHGGPGGVRQYEVFTREFVDALARAISALAAALHASLDARALRVLELGAGSGRLAHHLRAALAQLGCGSDSLLVIASDISPATGHFPLHFPVLESDYRASLARCLPDVVLVSWMPLGQDWSACIRSTPSVKAFFLVGETSGALCGDAQYTWGRAARGTTAQPTVPARVGGWTMRELAEVSMVQLCMIDEPWDNVRHSRTVLSVRDERTLALLHES